MRRVVRATAALLARLALAGALVASVPARAGARLDCDSPQVFRDAAVNVLVLPYRDSRSGKQVRGSPGWHLSTLLQQETLLALLKYQSIGVTELTSENKVCDAREVVDRVSRGEGPGQVAPGHGLLLIWGRVYEEGNDIFVQSYLRFLRKGQAEAAQASVATLGAPLRLAAELQNTALAMTPRRLSQRDLLELEARARQSLTLFKTPGGPSAGLLGNPEEPLSYGVLRSQGDWMYVRSMITGREGWMRARGDADNWALRRLLPELGYLDAVAGYLRLRSAEQQPFSGDLRRLHGWVRDLFANYERAVGRDAAQAPAALARVLLGLAQWHTEALGPAAERRRSASSLFDEAAALAPEVADYRNFSAVAAPYATAAEPRLTSTLARRLDGALLGAVALDARNAVALGNLERLYAALQAQPSERLFEQAYTAPALEQRLEIVRKGLAGLR